MNLNYSILWFEDDDDWYEAEFYNLEDDLEDEGFELRSCRETDSTNLPSHLEDRKFDLIAIDLNLDNGEKGSQIIQDLRKNDVFTEIVFYSSEGPDAVRKRLLNMGHHFDGVYCIDRDDFGEEVMRVIRTTTKKVEDLNNLRGLMMAALADYDNALNEFLLAASSRHSIHDFILEKVKEKVERSYESQKKSIESFKELSDLEEALKDHNLTSHARVNVVLSVLKMKKGCQTVNQLKEEIKTFQQELIKERNALAHAREDVNSFPPKLVGRDVEYDSDVFKHRRLELRKHLKVTRQLLELIEQGHFSDSFDK